MVALFLGLLITGLFFKCQILTHWYSYNTEILKQEVNESDCYNDELLQESDGFREMCIELVTKNNNLTEKWNNLPCITEHTFPKKIEIQRIILE